MDGELALRTPPADVLKMAAELPPRDLPAITKSIRNSVVAIPGMAQKCVYCRPVGKRDGKQTFALGPSVRLAEIAHENFGYIWIHGNVEETDKNINVETMAFDMKTLNIVFDNTTKSITKRNGYKFSQAQIEVTKSAAQAIGRRNVILQLTRAPLESIMNAVKEQIIKEMCPDEKKTYSSAFKNLCDLFKEYGVSKKELEKAAESETQSIDKLVLLIGIYNAVRDGLIDPADVFRVRGASKKPQDIKMPEPIIEDAEISDIVESGNGVLSEKEFLKMSYDMAERIGWADDILNKTISDQFNVESLVAIEPADYSKVIDFLTGCAEEANA